MGSEKKWEKTWKKRKNKKTKTNNIDYNAFFSTSITVTNIFVLEEITHIFTFISKKSLRQNHKIKTVFSTSITDIQNLRGKCKLHYCVCRSFESNFQDEISHISAETPQGHCYLSINKDFPHQSLVLSCFFSKTNAFFYPHQFFLRQSSICMNFPKTNVLHLYEYFPHQPLPLLQVFIKFLSH